MTVINRLGMLLFTALLLAGCATEAPVSSALPAGEDPSAGVLGKTTVDRADVTAFQAAGPAGAQGVLVEGDLFPPTQGGFLRLQRRCLRADDFF